VQLSRNRPGEALADQLSIAWLTRPEVLLGIGVVALGIGFLWYISAAARVGIIRSVIVREQEGVQLPFHVALFSAGRPLAARLMVVDLLTILVPLLGVVAGVAAFLASGGSPLETIDQFFLRRPGAYPLVITWVAAVVISTLLASAISRYAAAALATEQLPPFQAWRMGQRILQQWFAHTVNALTIDVLFVSATSLLFELVNPATIPALQSPLLAVILLVIGILLTTAFGAYSSVWQGVYWTLQYRAIRYIELLRTGSISDTSSLSSEESADGSDEAE
jgi:hypothetical protein